MNLKGTWGSGTEYSVEDIVRYTDGVFYILQKPCAAGITPIDTLYWGRLDQPIADALEAVFGLFGSVFEEIETIKESIPKNIGDDSISLKSGDDEYLITVDASGDTPELAVELIEEESEDDPGEGD